MSTTRLKDWLEISTIGFAQRQADRPPAHLVKELVQNALDAVTGVDKAYVDITIRPEKHGRKVCTKITVLDNGPGISDPSDLRTVFVTGKSDSYLLRGRLGQGFKEPLSLALQADVRSGPYAMSFTVLKGERVCDLQTNLPNNNGTAVSMWMPWGKDVVQPLTNYLHSFIVPQGVTMKVNGQVASGTNLPIAHAIPADLKTELFHDGKWVRRERPTTVHLITPPFPGDKPKIFELGIPVQEIDWNQNFHIDIQQRIPMNPRRDAVAAGYMAEVYSQILPVLMKELKPEELRDEWVSLAVEDSTPEVRQEVVRAAFGTNAVRSVPTFGKHDFDSDAREMGLKPIDTGLLPKGLRMAAQEVLQTSRQVELERRTTVMATPDIQVISPRDEALKRFIAWLAGELVGIPVLVKIVKELDINGPAVASWVQGGILSLSERYRQWWDSPLSEAFLGILCHEAAHEKAPHHGDDMRKEVEHMAGKLAVMCLQRGSEISARWNTELDALK